MAAAREPEDADPGRAELYLRLQVEAGLRRGLGAPRYEKPRERLFPERVQSAVLTKLQNRRHAMMIRRLRATTGGGATVVPLGLPRGRLGRMVIAAADRIRTSPLGRPLMFLAGYLRRLGQFWSAWRAGAYDTGRFRRLAWHVTGRWRQHSAEPTEATSVDTDVERITGLAAAMTAIGAISEATQTRVLEDYQTSLAIRGMTEPSLIFGHLPWRPWAQSPQPYTSGPLRATPVGLVADGEIDGSGGRIYLGTLVTGATSTTLTFRARFDQSAQRSQATSAQLRQVRARHHSMLQALQNFAATDSLGGSYSVHFSGGGGGEDWRGRLDISPVPAAAARWLDLSVPGATAPMRIPLDAAPPAHIVSARPLDPAGTADRYLDNCMVEQIQEIRPADDEDGGDWPGVFELAADLLAAGVLTTQNPSLGRLAAVAHWLKRRLPDPLSGVEPGVVPAEWLSLLARAASSDGPTGVIPVAAALPVVDGAHCVVTELESEADSMALQVHAQGWPDPHRYGVGRTELFRWSARDDVGGWYTSSESGWSYSDGEADMDLRLRPAVNPRARELQIILTGRTVEASVTVPLNWQPAPFRRVPLR
jgi:hypothetical protein